MLLLTFKDNPSVEHGVSIIKINDNVVQVMGKGLPQNTSGFSISRTDYKDNWDYSDYTTIYRIVDGNTIQFSNNKSVWDEPNKEVRITVNWDDYDNVEGYRPTELKVNITQDGRIQEITLKESLGWTCTLIVKQSSNVSIAECPEVPDYTNRTIGTTMFYSHRVHLALELEDRVYSLETKEQISSQTLDNIVSEVIPNQEMQMMVVSDAMDMTLSEIIPTQQEMMLTLAEAIDNILTEIIPQIIEEQVDEI